CSVGGGSERILTQEPTPSGGVVAEAPIIDPRPIVRLTGESVTVRRTRARGDASVRLVCITRLDCTSAVARRDGGSQAVSQDILLTSAAPVRRGKHFIQG